MKPDPTQTLKENLTQEKKDNLFCFLTVLSFFRAYISTELLVREINDVSPICVRL